MKLLLIWFYGVCLLVSAARAADKAQNPSDDRLNVLLICVDDLRPELKCFGADYIHSPNIDRLAASGRRFSRHYANAPSCGPSRYTLLTGRYGGASNNALFQRAKQLAKQPDAVPLSMPGWFRKHGYTTVSVGKVSHHPGGLGGKMWNSENKEEMPGAWDRHLMPVGEWQHPLGAMHGLAHGAIRKNPEEFPVFEAVDGPNSIYPDGLIAEEGLNQIELLAKEKKPFFLAVGLLKPHLPFGAPKRFLDLYKNTKLPSIPHPEKPVGITTWHNSQEFMKYNRWGKNPNEDAEFAEQVRLHYAACVSYSDEHVGLLLDKLKELDLAKDTVIVLWGDHGWHLGEHAIWGKHSLFEESLLSPLIIAYPGIEKPGDNACGVVETLDIFPTLCELTAIEKPSFSTGRSLVPMLHDPSAAGHSAVGYTPKAQTLRTDRYRFVLHKSKDVELYDHHSAEKETKNVADAHPEVVKELSKALSVRLSEN